MEYRRRRLGGVYRWFHTSVQPLLGPNGEVVRWYGLLTDIDDRRSMEESLRRTQGKLSQAMQLATASELAASIVHEISQPIAAMVANGQACLRWLSMSPPNDANARSVVERILRDGKDATPVIKGLRTLFKRSPPEKTFVNLYHTVAEVFTLVHGRAERQGVAIDLQVPEDLTQVAADRIQLQQVLLNLVSNAIDSMQDVVDNPKKLIIRSQRQENVILTEIVDQGVGVTDYEEIFETFFTTKENGMGMGLAICRSIIEAHDGRLWASPGSPAGSISSFTIPLPSTPV
jgi:C4-dicarboxylate-specific signal transduction histidine kinase